MPHIAVVGAGITGVTTAYALLQRGYSVSVYDKHRYAAMKTSFANGGQLSASNAEVWTQAGTILKGIKWMFNRNAPLLVNPLPSWHKYSWMAEFVSNVSNYEQNTVETVRLAIAAREHLFNWAAHENIAFDHESRGILHFYNSKKSFDHAQRINGLLKKGGLDRRAVTPEEIKQIEPTLNGGFYGGFFTESDSTGDIHKYTCGLSEACKRLGARFYYETEVQSIHPLSRNGMRFDVKGVDNKSGNSAISQYDGVVICAGVESRRFAAGLGDRVNVYPVKGYSITVELDDEESHAAAPWVSLLDDDAKVVTSRLGDDRFRIAGTAELNGINYDIRDDRIKPLIAWCRQYFPGVSTEKVIPWAGLRPMMPNMMPRVGKGELTGVYYNTGHGHLGWTLSAATAEMIGDVVSQSMPSNPLSMQNAHEYKKAS